MKIFHKQHIKYIKQKLTEQWETNSLSHCKILMYFLITDTSKKELGY